MSVAQRIIALSERRPPDFVIGGADDPYIRRWWLIPRNRWFNIYLHEILRDDDDRALHDHPWANCSIVLSGGYYDITPHGFYWRSAGSVTFRRAIASHRLALPDDPSCRYVNSRRRARGLKPLKQGCWSLFITGPVVREWGFHCPQGWVHWRVFTNPGDGGATVGAGCGETGDLYAGEN